MSSSIDLIRTVRRRIRPQLGRLLDHVIRIESTMQLTERPYDDPRMMHYQASDWLNVAIGMRGLKLRSDDVFMDFGCGKGRALYQASWYPFHRIIGVELDPAAARIAQRNMAKARGPRRVRAVEVLEGDARAVELPVGLRVAYLFNPFRGLVFADVAARLKRYAEANHRPLRIIYANPVEESKLRDLGFRCVRPSAHCGVYDLNPAGARLE